ncbi:PREDICTED: TM2 domain-containing protein 1 isoform X1 [Lepidothrix coronata]|uniref:TM2 domain-containing protein 1 isoform X1 n=4 Tax=Passeriformes TaxID=9126 RepID=A0A6J0GGT8_9PASS|nr:PREDICTED: TM2 domain-containing protein 1 isoform X1 [Lepidothrix coronata]
MPAVGAAIFTQGTAPPVPPPDSASAILASAGSHRGGAVPLLPGQLTAAAAAAVPSWPPGAARLRCECCFSSGSQPWRERRARSRRLSARSCGWGNMCDEPKIDNSTQEPMNCTNHTAYVQCLPAPNITCKDHLGVEKVFTGHEVGFYKPIECRNVNGYSYKVAVALSLFLGWLGADRFYLGYPALGLLKFCTVGFCGIGSLIDFILISMQIVGPSDGSSYIIDYYGARLTRLTITNATFRKMQTYP